jgi:anaerobic selenocysteine-containing dehydrogenase
LANPVLQFGLFTSKTHELQEEEGLFISPEYAEKLGISDGDEVAVATKFGNLNTKAILDNKISGEIPYIANSSLFGSYRFAEAKISKV